MDCAWRRVKKLYCSISHGQHLFTIFSVGRLNLIKPNFGRRRLKLVVCPCRHTIIILFSNLIINITRRYTTTQRPRRRFAKLPLNSTVGSCETAYISLCNRAKSSDRLSAVSDGRGNGLNTYTIFVTPTGKVWKVFTVPSPSSVISTDSSL